MKIILIHQSIGVVLVDTIKSNATYRLSRRHIIIETPITQVNIFIPVINVVFGMRFQA